MKALCKGFWKLSEYIAFPQYLTIVVRLELRALLEIEQKIHPEDNAH